MFYSPHRTGPENWCVRHDGKLRHPFPMSLCYMIFRERLHAVYLKTLRKFYSVTHDALLYDGSKIFMATRKNFRKLFPEKDLVKTYIKDNKLDLTKAQDALQLFNFLNLYCLRCKTGVTLLALNGMRLFFLSSRVFDPLPYP